MISLYKYSFSLNASHSMDYKKRHSHTFKVVLYIQTKDITLSFDEYEKLIDEYFESYRGYYINEIEPFDKIVPTLENMAEVFYKKIDEILLDCDLDLKRLEIGDNYTISVSLGEILMVGSNHRIIDEKKFEDYKDKILKKYDKSIIEKKEKLKEPIIKKDFVMPTFISKSTSNYEDFESFIKKATKE